MIENQLDNTVNIKDQLLKLSLRHIRLEAKKLSVHLYSRKTKAALVDLILEYKKRVLIKNDTNDEVVSEEERIAYEKAQVEEERIALEKAQLEEERIALEKAQVEEERIALEKAQVEEERIALEKAQAEEVKTIISNKNAYLKNLLSKSFPGKKISVIDNKDGSQTILIL